jgi:hypothetical protein
LEGLITLGRPSAEQASTPLCGLQSGEASRHRSWSQIVTRPPEAPFEVSFSGLTDWRRLLQLGARRALGALGQALAGIIFAHCEAGFAGRLDANAAPKATKFASDFRRTRILRRAIDSFISERGPARRCECMIDRAFERALLESSETPPQHFLNEFAALRATILQPHAIVTSQRHSQLRARNYHSRKYRNEAPE